MPPQTLSGRTPPRPKPKKKKVVKRKPIITVGGPTSGGRTTPKQAAKKGQQARIKAATKKYTSERGPIGQRTTGHYTKPQQRKRAKLRERRRDAETVRLMTTGQPTGPKSGGSKYARQMGPTSGGGWTPKDAKRARIARHRMESNNPAGPTSGGATPYYDKEEWARSSLATDLQNQVSQIKKNADKKGRDLTPAEMLKIEELQSMSLLAANESKLGKEIGKYVSAPARGLFQIAESLVYTPAFFVQLYKDPLGTLKKMPNAIYQDFRHPLDNPGYLLMDLLGAKGVMGGIAAKAGALGKLGKAGARPRTLGSVARTVLLPTDAGMTRLAEGSYRLNPRTAAITPLKVRQKTGRAAGQLVPDRLRAEASARHVGHHRRKQREVTAGISTARARGLRAEARKLKKDPAASEAIRAVADQTPMEARVATFEERLASGVGTKGDRKLTEKRLEAAREADARGLTQVFVEPHPELKGRTIQRVEINPEAAILHSRIRDIPGLRRRGNYNLARIENLIMKESRRSEALAIVMGELDAGRAAAHLMEPGDVFATGQKGRYHITEKGPGKPPPSGRVRMGDNALGIPDKSQIGTSWESTGWNRQGGLGDPNAARAVADLSLRRQHLRAKRETWRAAKDESITARELLALPESEAKYYRSVRMNKKPSTGATRNFLDNYFNKDEVFGMLPEKDVLAAQAEGLDAAGQVRFFDKRRHNLEVFNMNPGGVMGKIGGFADAFNKTAKFALLFTKGLAYITPNLLGVGFMTAMHGVLPFLDGGFSRVMGAVRRLDDTEAAVFKEMIGVGATKGIQYENRGTGVFNAVNQGAANFYAAITDDFWRANVGVAEMNAKGYTTDALRSKLLNSKPGSKEFLDMTEISRRVGEALGDFTMTPMERAFMGRIIFFYPWIRASTIYAAKLPRTHPIKTAGLVQGGRVAQDTVQAQLGMQIIEMLNAKGGAGTFVVGYRENGDPIVVNPQSAAVLQGPFDIVTLLQQFTGLFDENGAGAEPIKKLLSMGTPAIEAFGAAAGYNTFYGDSFPSDMSLGDRLLETVKGYSPQLTMWNRLNGDGTGTYDYTRNEAISAGAVLGSIQPKGMNWKKVTSDAEKFQREKTGEKAPKPLTGHKSLLRWAEKQPKSRVNAEALDDLKKWEQSEHMIYDAERKLATELGLMRETDAEEPSTSRLSDRQRWAIRAAVLHKLRPDKLASNWKEIYKETWEKGTKKQIDDMLSYINDMLGYADKWGSQIDGRIDKLRQSAKPGKR